ncbi:hypothetical protein ACSFA3_20780 [Variovorax sp. RHLX14]
MKQLYAHARFQASDGFSDGRLRQAQTLGGLREVFRSRRRDEDRDSRKWISFRHRRILFNYLTIFCLLCAFISTLASRFGSQPPADPGW